MNIIIESKWFIDSECSRHMTGDPSQFIKTQAKVLWQVTFGDDMKTKTIGIGDIGKIGEILVHNVLL